MYLHDNRDLFSDVLEEVNIQTGISIAIIEKDYYVTMILKLLAKKNPDIVFKGGTSLSKCFQLINRFSEDIDGTFSEHIGESRRKKLKYNILKPISEELGLPIGNWNRIQSDRDYNYYLFEYQPIDDFPETGLMPGIKLETALHSYSFPTEHKEITSIIYDTLKDNVPDIINDYELYPFSMEVQSVSRTFIDKIFALCDYYIEGKSMRYSRHLYDIYMLAPTLSINNSFKELVSQVREHRATLSICPSAKPDVNILSLIEEFIDVDFYKSDYENITKNLIKESVSYTDAIAGLHDIATQIFSDIHDNSG